MTPSCHPRRWNITIVVLLLMVASGLLALLTLQFVKHFLTSSNVLANYYKSYYMARGGLEAMLTEANLRGYGFQYDLWQTDIEKNYYDNCKESALCDMQGNVVAQGVAIYDSPDSLISQACEPTEMISLQPGASSAYPLFYDRWSSANLSFAPVQSEDYAKLDLGWFDITLSGWSLEAYLYDAGEGSFGRITASETVHLPGQDALFAQQSLVHTHWLIVTNPQNNTTAVSYCLNSDDAAHKLVGNYTRITAQATYSDKTVGVTALKKFVFPSAFIQ